MELFLISTLLILTISYFYFLLKPKHNNATQNLPLPPGHVYWPLKLFETLDYLSKAKTDTIHKFFAERKDKYSRKLFKTSHLGQNMVFLCGPEANKFLFANDYKLVRSWWPDTFLKVFENAGDEMTMEQVMRARKQFLSFFNEPEALARHVGITDEVVKDHFRKFWDDFDQVTVAPLARKLTFAVSCRLLADIRDRETLEKLLPSMGSIVDALFAMPINLPGTKFNRAIKESRKAREIFLDIIKQRKIELFEKKKKSESNDILSRMLLENYRDGEEVSDIVLAKNLVALLSSAYDNPSLVIVSIVKTLAELPEIYDKVRREQLEIAKSKGPEEHLSMEDIKRMKYSTNVLNETLRLEPPASGTFREALTDFSYEGFRIPKGWKIHWSVCTQQIETQNTFQTQRSLIHQDLKEMSQKCHTHMYHLEEVITHVLVKILQNYRY
ncbi:Cytochrome P450 [Melia azedarach]|uniref:Cytochrome P450 n=1 Tax=Melia azedarach TaxID=155640 RepID=A0ACC1YJD7_MELAZ|nr:Cytochrome P450 [Melia azedarach]